MYRLYDMYDKIAHPLRFSADLHYDRSQERGFWGRVPVWESLGANNVPRHTPREFARFSWDPTTCGKPRLPTYSTSPRTRIVYIYRDPDDDAGCLGIPHIHGTFARYTCRGTPPPYYGNSLASSRQESFTREPLGSEGGQQWDTQP